jgi:hypothetical protein
VIPAAPLRWTLIALAAVLVAALIALIDHWDRPAGDHYRKWLETRQ